MHNVDLFNAGIPVYSGISRQDQGEGGKRRLGEEGDSEG
jgi:hypothetical protein